MALYGREAAAEDLERVNRYKGALLTAAKEHGVRASVLAGICSRETRGGVKKFLIGDGGHGCGPMQIDDRSFPAVTKAYKAGQKSDEEMVNFGGRVLKDKAMALRATFDAVGKRDLLERAAIAAYNCGQGNVKNMILAGREDFDSRTTGKNYSADVLERAAFFAEHGY